MKDPYDSLIRRIAESKGQVSVAVSRLFAPLQPNVVPVDNRSDTSAVVGSKPRRIKK